MITQWVHYIHVITFNKGMWCLSTRIELFYFDNNLRRIPLWVSAFSLM